jgi:hypothetical protein
MERIITSLDAASVSVINRVVGLIGLVAGLTFILGGGFMIHHNHLDEFLLNPAVAEGQVVENKSKQNYPGTGSRILPFTSYQAIVQFTDQQGQTVTYRDAFGFNHPSFQVGRVRIFYDPQNPQRAMIDRGLKNYLIPAICLGFGGLLILGGLQRLRYRT